MSDEISETESNFCHCGAILLPDRMIEEDGKNFFMCGNGHKIPIRPSVQKQKGRAVSFGIIYDKI